MHPGGVVCGLKRRRNKIVDGHIDGQTTGWSHFAFRRGFEGLPLIKPGGSSAPPRPPTSAMVTETEPVTSTRAEINFVRLALACEAQPDGGSAAAGDGVGGASEWRRLEAYARRLRELLEDIRRGEQHPSKQQLVEYERMLSAVAARADLARRQTEEQAREARGRTAWHGGGVSAHALADTAPLSAEAPALNAAVAPTLKKSLVDRRSQLLGEGGESARARLVRRGGGAGGPTSSSSSLLLSSLALSDTQSL